MAFGDGSEDPAQHKTEIDEWVQDAFKTAVAQHLYIQIITADKRSSKRSFSTVTAECLFAAIEFQCER